MMASKRHLLINEDDERSGESILPLVQGRQARINNQLLFSRKLLSLSERDG
jgi:hypothetical protein